MENIYYVMGIISAPEEEANQLAKSLVQKKLAACAQVSTPVTSTYWWDGKVEETTEALIYIKTETGRVHAIKEFLKTHHSYDVPEFIVVPIMEGNPAYLKWVSEVVH